MAGGTCGSPHRRKRRGSAEEAAGVSGFSGALHRHPSPLPANLLRRLTINENYNVGKVRVMLRVTEDESEPKTDLDREYLKVDKKWKQVTLFDPANTNQSSPTPEDRQVGVVAPKMFAFDAIFTAEDPQTDVTSSALVDLIHAVLSGTDGCLFCYGHSYLGKSLTMLGNSESTNSFGVIPCAISWLFKSIAEQKQKTGNRFSVRVSAIAVGTNIRDLLIGQITDAEQAPCSYLKDEPLLTGQLLNSQTELRAPTPEKAAFYLDCALSSRENAHLLYTLHVYQYSVASKGGVAGGRSRLHLIDTGYLDRNKEPTCLPLSVIGNILIAIFNGQKHLPHREHLLTQVLKECMSSLTCQVTVIAHVSPAAHNYPETLSVIQLASRIHRMRRRRPKVLGGASNGILGLDENGRLTGSSDVDPSSSEQSADTVIYLGGHTEETDDEHPPVFIPSLASGDNRPCLIDSDSKNSCSKSSKFHVPSFSRDKVSISKSVPNSPQKVLNPSASHSMNKSMLYRNSLVSRSERASKPSSSKSSPVRSISLNRSKESVKNPSSTGEELWIDGPRISRSKVAEARNLHLLNKGGKTNLISNRETWVDGPMKPSLIANDFGPNYGFMDSHKKSMIRKWVENQTFHIQNRSHRSKSLFKELTVFKTYGEDDDDKDDVPEDILNIEREQRGHASGQEEEDDDCEETEEVEPIQPQESTVIVSDSKVVQIMQLQSQMDEDTDKTDAFDKDVDIKIVQVLEPEESIPMRDSCLQVTEEDIAKCMGEIENPLPEVDQESPHKFLSQESLTDVSTFPDSRHRCNEIGRLFPESKHCSSKQHETPRPPNSSNSNENKFEQLSRLHELYRSKMGLTLNSKQLLNGIRAVSRCQSFSVSDNLQNEPDNNSLHGSDFDNSSIVSEPAYLPGDTSKVGRFCDNCLVSLCCFQDENGIWPPPTRLYGLGPLNNLSSLRHPDGASNPNLRAETEQRESGEGAKEEEENEEYEELPVPPPPPSNLLTLSRESFNCLKPKLMAGNVNRHTNNSCSTEQVHDPGGIALHYCQEDVETLDRGWNEARRNGRLKQLKREQRHLMAELAAAKCRILFAAPSWNNELSGI